MCTLRSYSNRDVIDTALYNAFLYMCTAWLVRRVSYCTMFSYLFGGKSFWFESWDFMWNLVKSCYFSLRLWFCNCLQLSWFYFHKNGGEFVKSWDISAGYHNISHQICSFCEKLRNIEIFWEGLVNCVYPRMNRWKSWIALDVWSWIHITVPIAYNTNKDVARHDIPQTGFHDVFQIDVIEVQTRLI